MQDLDKIVAEAIAAFDAVGDAAQLEQAKARFLGKQGVLTELLKGLGKLAPEARRDAGAGINAAASCPLPAISHSPRRAFRESP